MTCLDSSKGITALRRREHSLDLPWYAARVYVHYCHDGSNIPISCSNIEMPSNRICGVNDFLSVLCHDITPDALTSALKPALLQLRSDWPRLDLGT